MSSPFTIFRKHQKLLLAVFGVMLMVVFTVGYSLSQIAGEGGGGGENPVVVQWNGDQLTRDNLESLRTLRAYLAGFLQIQRQEAVQKGAYAEERQQQIQAMMAGDFSQRLPFEPIFRQGDATNEGTVRALLLANRARQHGFVVSDYQVWKYLDGLVDKRTSRKELAGIIKQRGYSLGDAFDALRGQMLAFEFLEQFNRAASVVPPAQQFEYYKRFNREVTIEALAIPVDRFLDKVANPPDSGLEAYFEKHKLTLPQSDFVAGVELTSPDPAFKLPDRVAIEYVRGNGQTFIDAVADDVTEEEIAAYYEENKLRDEELRIQEFDSDEGLPTIDDLDIDSSDKTVPDEPVGDQTDSPAAPEKDGTPADGSKSDAADSPDADKSVPNSAAVKEPPVRKEDSGQAPAAPDKKVEDKPAEDSNPANEDGASIAPGVKSVFTLLNVEATKPPGDSESDTTQPETPKADDAAKPADADDTPKKDQPAAADPPTEDGSDSKPPAEKPVEPTTPASPPADGEVKNAAGSDAKDTDSAEEKPKEPEFKFKPLDEVRDYIRGRLTEQKAAERMRKSLKIVHAKMASYHSALIRTDEGQKPSQPRPDLKALAQKFGLEYHVAELQSLKDFNKSTGIGKSYDPSGEAGGRNIPFAQLAFQMGKESLFTPHPTQDEDENHYVFWLLDEAESAVGKLTGSLRERVIRSWKLGAGLEDDTDKARGLARKQAEQLAERMRGGVVIADLADEQDGSEIISTPAFAWLQRAGFGGVAINPIMGVDQPGQEFMESVFALAPGGVTVTINYPRTHVYVVRLMSENKSSELLQQEYLDRQQDPQVNMQISGAEQLDRSTALQHWIRGLENEMQLEWLKPELRFQ